MAHHICGADGKQANCQVSVEVGVSDGEMAASVAGRLYLPVMEPATTSPRSGRDAVVAGVFNPILRLLRHNI